MLMKKDQVCLPYLLKGERELYTHRVPSNEEKSCNDCRTRTVGGIWVSILHITQVHDSASGEKKVNEER